MTAAAKTCKTLRMRLRASLARRSRCVGRARARASAPLTRHDKRPPLQKFASLQCTSSLAPCCTCHLKVTNSVRKAHRNAAERWLDPVKRAEMMQGLNFKGEAVRLPMFNTSVQCLLLSPAQLAWPCITMSARAQPRPGMTCAHAYYHECILQLAMPRVHADNLQKAAAGANMSELFDGIFAQTAGKLLGGVLGKGHGAAGGLAEQLARERPLRTLLAKARQGAGEPISFKLKAKLDEVIDAAGDTAGAVTEGIGAAFQGLLGGQAGGLADMLSRDPLLGGKLKQLADALGAASAAATAAIQAPRAQIG